MTMSGSVLGFRVKWHDLGTCWKHGR